MADIDTLGGLAVALGIGLLVGIERERRGAGGGHPVAGVRTFALVALSGAVAERLGTAAMVIGAAFVALAALASYRASRERDPGLTTEVAMLLVFLLGVLALRETTLAAGLGVAVALLLSAKSRVHHFVQRVLTEQELHDALLLAAGYAPDYAERPLDSPEMAGMKAIVEHVLKGHEPYPALAVDRHGFSDYVTEKVTNHPQITVVHEEVPKIPMEEESEYLVCAVREVQISHLNRLWIRRYLRWQEDQPFHRLYNHTAYILLCCSE